MADTNDPALEVIKRILAKPNPTIWPLGSWLKREETPEDRTALASLPPMMGYPEGGQIALFLTGWNERSVWGFDPPNDAYFAQLWRNGSPNEHPDIWIFGRGHVDGREFVVTSARLLAREIAAATGFDLSKVCTAMTGGQHRVPPDLPEPDRPPKPPISLKDELGEQGWF